MKDILDKTKIACILHFVLPPHTSEMTKSLGSIRLMDSGVEARTEGLSMDSTLPQVTSCAGNEGQAIIMIVFLLSEVVILLPN